MMHKAWCSIEEVPYCFPRSSIKFQGHTGRKIDDLDKIWARLLGRSQLPNPSDLPCCYAIQYIPRIMHTIYALLCFAVVSYWMIHTYLGFIWVRSRNWGCLVTWFCYQLIAKPGNKTAAVLWPDPFHFHLPFRDHFVNALSQWETALHCNVISHCLGAFTRWSVIILNSRQISCYFGDDILITVTS